MKDMVFERERCKQIVSPTERQIVRELSLVKSSFASLTASDGSFVQVAGGPGLFLLEYRELSGQHSRASQSVPVVPFPDGTVLSFSAGNVEMAQGQWFLLKQITEVFTSFLNGNPFPTWVSWMQLTEEFAAVQQKPL